jgi:hypothetical protein
MLIIPIDEYPIFPAVSEIAVSYLAERSHCQGTENEEMVRDRLEANIMFLYCKRRVFVMPADVESRTKTDLRRNREKYQRQARN